MTFRNVDELKQRLVKSAWVWSRTLSTLLATKASACLCSHNGPTCRTFSL